MASVLGEVTFDQPCADDDHFARMALSSKNWKSVGLATRFLRYGPNYEV